MPAKKAKPIKDLNSKQWDKVEANVIRLVQDEETADLSDNDTAVRALGELLGEWRESKDGESEYLRHPSGGYTPDLIDGVESVVRLRRKQFGGVHAH